MWGDPATAAAAISETAPHAAVRRVNVSWSVRVMDMVVLLKSGGNPIERTAAIAEPFMASTIADRSDAGPLSC
ncbi:hypothetical protein GCM10023194_67990 [Planotetraspora phitsanulokensis]|uniref:Uncharacterized protein n=1 Tax=Planotetraspora phitsanulokensis TaxID=575192 RepID=A0A8J3U6R5_9ACTN|nr:hypothetical protein Pph01_46410 [Planotetraspora phitsanulokensis]